MAFPLPAHLPRAGFSQDGSSFGSTSSTGEPFLKKLGEATPEALTRKTLAGWVRDVDTAIQATKDRIHQRVQSDLPAFEEQLESTRLAQSRLRSLSTSVGDLGITLNDTETGILPTLLKVLNHHSELTRQHCYAEVKDVAMSHLLKCKNGYTELLKVAADGHLALAVQKADALQSLIEDAPKPLHETRIMTDMKRRFRIAVDRLQEQISDAFSRSITIKVEPGVSSLSIFPQVRILGSEKNISLPDILASMKLDVVNANLINIRKDLISKLVEPLLSQKSVTTQIRPISQDDTATSFEIHFSASKGSTPLQNLQGLLTYIQDRLAPALPVPHSHSFFPALYKPITEAILSHLLRPSTPTSISGLPAYLRLVTNTVAFEAEMDDKMGIAFGKEKILQEWARDVGGHFEKRRRETIVTTVRDLIEDPEGDEDGVGVRVEEEPVASPAVHVPSESEDSSASSGVVVETPASYERGDEVAWDFDDPPVAGPSSAETASVEPEVDLTPEAEEAWGFDDEDPSPPSPIVTTQERAAEEVMQARPNSWEPDSEPEPEADGWGWDDELPKTPMTPHPQPPKSPPKQAKGLERFSATHSSFSSTSPSSSPFKASMPLASSHSPSSLAPPMRRQAHLQAKLPRETYLISPSAQMVLALAEKTLLEGVQLMESGLLPVHDPPRGTLIVAAAPSVFDLYRSLYPIAHPATLTSSPTYSTGDSMRFSNDCKFLASQISHLGQHVTGEATKAKLLETRERLQRVGESWFDMTLASADRELAAINEILARADGFVDTGDDHRLTVCRSAMEQAFRNTTATTRAFKNTLTKSKYLEAAGYLVDEILSRVIDDVTSLRDIPEMESHRLNELLKILFPLEDLFANDDGSTTVVAHVPSWLKFSYLAELLEASMADISYLFDEGTLVDFEVDELVRMVQALFAETPLRAKTIEKISAGHPVS
ncbi:hypothetical protein FRB96_002178 [Tulasnella sp. 330]|nr:hypothetical protein FRB96_002178 [Tulasnella sp. 330]